MKEQELFSAYGLFHERADESPISDEDWQWIALEEIDLNEIHRGRIRCMVPRCPVMIAVWAQRRICRFHQKTYDDAFDQSYDVSKLST
jgi:hypothetical protein